MSQRFQMNEDRFREAHARGLNYTQMAEELGCSKESIRYWHIKLQLKPNGGNWSRTQKRCFICRGPTKHYRCDECIHLMSFLLHVHRERCQVKPKNLEERIQIYRHRAERGLPLFEDCRIN